jgi:hypothetical protein
MASDKKFEWRWVDENTYYIQLLMVAPYRDPSWLMSGFIGRIVPSTSQKTTYNNRHPQSDIQGEVRRNTYVSERFNLTLLSTFPCGQAQPQLNEGR